VRDEQGPWRYADTGIAAVGARDVTLGETADPPVIARAGREPEAVLIPLSSIIEDPRLNWALQAGTKLEGDQEPLFKVSWSVWQEHAAEPVDAWLPECDASGIDRHLAIAERQLRFAKQALDTASQDRVRMIVLATHVGRSRRDIGETLGLSAGRVQQLNEDPASAITKEVDDFVRDAAIVASLIRDGPYRREDIPLPRGFGRDRLEEIVDSMITLELLEEGAIGLQVTNDGEALVGDVPDSAVQRSDQTKSTSRKRARHAPQ
jgi:hypothetical protein